MQTYRIEFEKQAEKFLARLDKTQRLRIYKEIYKLPSGSDIKKLKGTDLYRLRVGKYRILYAIDDVIRCITIEAMDSRGQVYNRY